MPDAETIVVGAGPAGLACAAALGRSGGSVIVLEKADRVAASWRRHYDRLHLHTHKRQSGLPGLPMPAAYPKYPSRDQLVAYLEDYAAHHRIAPRFGTTVLGVRQHAGWVIETDTATLTAGNVIFATGIAGWPLRPAWPGMDSFPGRLIHSSDYANPKPFARCRVLVVGLGNSGGEIAMDLCDAGNNVSLSVRGPVNVVPRDLLGIPILTLAILQRSLPYKLVDALNAPILRLAIGDLEPFGLRRPAKGPMTQVAEDGKVPLLDIGTIDRIRRGLITVRPGIARMTGADVHFDDGARAPFDVIIQATGYRPSLRSLLPDHQGVLDRSGAPIVCGRPTGHPGLFFCGHIAVATGQLREIGLEAERIAATIRAGASREFG
jgi:cation diffusion facilitator CzcD-associated flavoprotein CzcO